KRGTFFSRKDAKFFRERTQRISLRSFFRDFAPLREVRETVATRHSFRQQLDRLADRRRVHNHAQSEALAERARLVDMREFLIEKMLAGEQTEDELHAAFLRLAAVEPVVLREVHGAAAVAFEGVEVAQERARFFRRQQRKPGDAALA